MRAVLSKKSPEHLALDPSQGARNLGNKVGNKKGHRRRDNHPRGCESGGSGRHDPPHRQYRTEETPAQAAQPVPDFTNSFLTLFPRYISCAWLKHHIAPMAVE